VKETDHRFVPERIDTSQPTLFPLTYEDLCSQAEVTHSELSAWRALGLLSFDPAPGTRFEPAHVAEAQFLAGLMRSGLPQAFITQLLATLIKPYSYHPFTTAYSFVLRRWIGVAQKYDQEEVVDEYLCGLEEEQNIERLVELLQDIAGRIGGLATALQEGSRE